MKKVDKERVMDLIEKAGDAENYETAWDEKGNCNFKKKTNIKRGRISRARGARFELKVRKDLEEKGRVVDKWSNNIEFESEEDFEKGKIIPAKRKFNPFSKVMTIGTGFPDFISIKQISEGIYSVIGVEVKMNGILSKIEKEERYPQINSIEAYANAYEVDYKELQIHYLTERILKQLDNVDFALESLEESIRTIKNTINGKT